MATAIALRLRVNNNSRAIQSHRFVKLLSSSFSSSSSSSSSASSNPKVEEENTTQSSSSSPSSKSSVSSYLKEVRARLKQEPPQQQQRQPHSPLYTRLSTEKPSSPPANWQTIRENLSDFRSRTAVPVPQRRERPSSPDISFQELYKRNVIPQDKESSNSLSKFGISFADIHEKLKKQRNQTSTDGGGATSFSRFLGGGGSVKLRPLDPNQREPAKMIGGEQQNLPASIFGKEINKNSAEELPNDMEKRKYVRMYTHKELGERLRGLRTEEAKGFSLRELNERLIKLRELDQKEASNAPVYYDIRDTLRLLDKKDENPNQSFVHRLEIMSQIGGTPNFMLSPPKEQLVEKYFHPDNMSSAEKMKLELKRVRDEFKMSESDCGSSRVQVALLTTKIKHLSTALHKKDKHSRKGLQAMVQKRKKLLKYMRRTDWDSYCLVLSKLGLRDNPDYKN